MWTYLTTRTVYWSFGVTADVKVWYLYGSLCLTWGLVMMQRDSVLFIHWHLHTLYPTQGGLDSFSVERKFSCLTSEDQVFKASYQAVMGEGKAMNIGRQDSLVLHKIQLLADNWLIGTTMMKPENKFLATGKYIGRWERSPNTRRMKAVVVKGEWHI